MHSQVLKIAVPLPLALPLPDLAISPRPAPRPPSIQLFSMQLLLARELHEAQQLPNLV